MEERSRTTSFSPVSHTNTQKKCFSFHLQFNFSLQNSFSLNSAHTQRTTKEGGGRGKKNKIDGKKGPKKNPHATIRRTLFFLEDFEEFWVVKSFCFLVVVSASSRYPVDRRGARSKQKVLFLFLFFPPSVFQSLFFSMRKVHRHTLHPSPSPNFFMLLKKLPHF